MKHLTDIHVEFSSAEKKKYEVPYILDGKERTYRPDFVLEDKIIEVKPKSLLHTLQNTAKFKAAKQLFGDKFIIITEDDFKMIDDITELIESGEVKLMDRYVEKYKLRKLNENN